MTTPTDFLDDPVSMPSMPTMRPGGDADALGRIDQYDILRKLGGGGFGVVYLARDTASGVEVAIKTLHPMLKHDAEEMENLRTKFALVARLTHQNIAKALVLHPCQRVDVWDEAARRELRVSPGDSVMVMDYAPGATLSKWRKQFPGGIVPRDLALEVGRQVAAALDYAHGEKIVHRDIKPGNIMVETVMPPPAAPQALDNGNGVPPLVSRLPSHVTSRIRVRLLDFGLAAEIRSSMSRVSTETGDTSGTRPYMAPEQWLGKKQDGRTDQYALACVLYELLSGAPPFAGVFETGDPAVMMATVEKRAPDAVPGFSHRANAALLRALAKDPNGRFPSCTAFVDEVARAVTASRGGAHSARRILPWVAAAAVAVLGFAAIRFMPSGTSVSPVPPVPPVLPDAPSTPPVLPVQPSAAAAPALSHVQEAAGEVGGAGHPGEPRGLGEATASHFELSPDGASAAELRDARTSALDALGARRDAYQPDDSLALEPGTAAVRKGKGTARLGFLKVLKVETLSFPFPFSIRGKTEIPANQTDAAPSYRVEIADESGHVWQIVKGQSLGTSGFCLANIGIRTSISITSGKWHRDSWAHLCFTNGQDVVYLDEETGVPQYRKKITFVCEDGKEPKEIVTYVGETFDLDGEPFIVRGIGDDGVEVGSASALDVFGMPSAFPGFGGVIRVPFRDAWPPEEPPDGASLQELVVADALFAVYRKSLLKRYTEKHPHVIEVTEAISRVQRRIDSAMPNDADRRKHAAAYALIVLDALESVKQRAVMSREKLATQGLGAKHPDVMAKDALIRLCDEQIDEHRGSAAISRQPLAAEDIRREIERRNTPLSQDDLSAMAKVRDVFSSAWIPPAEADASNDPVLRIDFLDDGSFAHSLAKSSGNAVLDQSVLDAAGSVRALPSLPDGFVQRNPSMQIEFHLEHTAHDNHAAAKPSPANPPQNTGQPNYGTAINTVRIDLGGGVTLEMVHCPGVSSDFWIGKYEVTQEQWKQVMGTEPSHFNGKPKNPVENVSWNDCQEFVKNLNALPAAQKTGLVFRLPEEKEWETACRAGAPKSADYCKLADGTQITALTLGKVARFGKGWDDGPVAVGSFLPNAWGLYDMHGNVWEWTQTEIGVDRVNRGGSFRGTVSSCTAGRRDVDLSGFADRYNGLRLAASGRAAAASSQPNVATLPSDDGEAARSAAASRSEAHTPGERMVVKVGGIDVALRWCPPGTFTMGSPSNEEGRGSDEQQHQVTLAKGFWMGETEVTRRLWKEVMGGLYLFSLDHPMEDITWTKWCEFVDKLNQRVSVGPNLKFSIPTEAQWEYACRAGTTGAYGIDAPENEIGYFGISPPALIGTIDVASKKQNAWGLYDMHGNVWEWCSDWYGPYPKGSVDNSVGSATGDARVIRGGAWLNSAQTCRSAYRGKCAPETMGFIGLRIVLSE